MVRRSGENAVDRAYRYALWRIKMACAFGALSGDDAIRDGRWRYRIVRTDEVTGTANNAISRNSQSHALVP